MGRPIQVDVQVADGVSGVPCHDDIRRWLAEAVAEDHRLGQRAVEFSVRIVDEDEGRTLNREYRERDRATNVLSFPLMDLAIEELPADLPLALGDIVICEPVVRREAEEQGRDPAHHWAHLLVHGALHLLGHDHETDREAAEMEALETRILSRRGIPDPYSEASLRQAAT